MALIFGPKILADTHKAKLKVSSAVPIAKLAKADKATKPARQDPRWSSCERQPSGQSLVLECPRLRPAEFKEQDGSNPFWLPFVVRTTLDEI
jgi:hypothetical protein